MCPEHPCEIEGTVKGLQAGGWAIILFSENIENDAWANINEES